MAFKMIYDEESVTLVGKKSLSLKVPNPEYVTEHTWPKIKDFREDHAFKSFQFWVSRAIQFHEIEHSEKGPCRVVLRDHPEPNHQVVLSYDNNEVRLETGFHDPLIFAARFPHFVFEQLLVRINEPSHAFLVHMKDKKPRHALHIFLYEARYVAYKYEFPNSSIILKYFEDYEYPEEMYDYDPDDYHEDTYDYDSEDTYGCDCDPDECLEDEEEPELVAAAPVVDPFAGIKAAGFVQVRAEPAGPPPEPVPAPVKKSFWSRIWSRFR